MFDGFRWGFDLPNYNYVESWSLSIFSPDVSVFADEVDAQPPQFFWSSSHLNELDDGAEVLERARQLKALFDGALYLVDGLQARPLQLGSVRYFGSGSHHSGYGKPAPKIGPFSKEVCARPLDREAARRVSERLIEGSIFTARTDRVVFGMLASLGLNGPNFPTLYALTDTMQTHGMSEQDQWQAAGSTKAEWRRFTGTANNFAALGPNARHGDKGWNLKHDPMDQGRAAEIVLAAAKAFISKRIIRATAMLERKNLAVSVTAPPPSVSLVQVDRTDQDTTKTASGTDRRPSVQRRRALATPALWLGLSVAGAWIWRRANAKGIRRSGKRKR